MAMNINVNSSARRKGAHDHTRTFLFDTPDNLEKTTVEERAQSVRCRVTKVVWQPGNAESRRWQNRQLHPCVPIALSVFCFPINSHFHAPMHANQKSKYWRWRVIDSHHERAESVYEPGVQVLNQIEFQVAVQLRICQILDGGSIPINMQRSSSSSDCGTSKSQKDQELLDSRDIAASDRFGTHTCMWRDKPNRYQVTACTCASENMMP